MPTRVKVKFNLSYKGTKFLYVGPPGESKSERRRACLNENLVNRPFLLKPSVSIYVLNF